MIRSFADAADLNIASPVMESHQKNAGGNARIAETMFRYFRFPKDFASFVWLSQVQQGLAIKTAVDYWRSLKPHCMGALYWQLNDTWPVACWSSLDYGGGWKLLHHMARRFFQPVNVVVIPDRRHAPRRRGQRHRRGRCASRQRSGRRHGRHHPAAARRLDAVGTDAAVTLAEIRAAALEPGEVLAFRWQAVERHGRRRRRPAGPPQGPRPPRPEVRVTTEGAGGAVRARLGAEALALFVTLEADRPGRFSTNAVTLFPGHDAEITFTPADGDPAAVTLTARDLYSSYREPLTETKMTDFSYQLYSSRNFPPLSDTLKMLKRRRLHVRRGLRRALRRRRPRWPSSRSTSAPAA